MEQLVQEYYDSPCFADKRKELESQGKDAKKVIYDLIVDRNKLKDMLSQITGHNILAFFENLASNVQVNQMMTDSFKKVVQDAFDCDNIRDVFTKICLDAARKEEYLDIHKNILKNIKNITEMQVNYNIKNMDLDCKVIEDTVKKLVKSKTGGDISITIEECIKDMYKNNITIKDETLKKITRICGQFDVPFPEMITALMNNTQEKLLENTQLLIDTEFKIMHESFKKDLAKYLINLENNYKEQHKTLELNQGDIKNILENVQSNNKKIQKINESQKNSLKTNVSLIQRIVEQSIDKKIEQKINMFQELLGNSKEKALEKRINEIEKKLKKEKDNSHILKHIDNLNNSFEIVTNTIEKISDRIDKLEKRDKAFVLKDNLNQYVTVKDFYNINDSNSKDTLKLKTNLELLETTITELKKESTKNHSQQNISQIIDNQMDILEKKINKELKTTKEILNKKLNAKLYENNFTSMTKKLNCLEKQIIVYKNSHSKDNDDNEIKMTKLQVERLCNKLISGRLNTFHKSLNIQDTFIEKMNIKKIVSEALNQELIIDVITNKIKEINASNIMALTNSLNDIHNHISILYQQNQYVHNIPQSYYFQ